MVMAKSILRRHNDQKPLNLIATQPKIKEQYCRLCLSIDESQFKNLFSPFDSSQNIVQIIERFAKVSILLEDEYSKLICSKCFIKLTESHDFKSLIETSDFKLRNQQTICEDPLDDVVDNDDNYISEGDSSDHEKVPVEETVVKNEISTGSESVGDSTENKQPLRKKKTRNTRNNDKDIDINEFIHTEIIEDVKDEEISNETSKTVRAKKKVVSGQKNKVIKKRGRPKVVEKDDDLPLIKIKKKRIRREYHLKCPDCDKVFKRHELFRRHRISHTGVYPFHCTFCNKGFASRGHLKVHEINHTEIRNYQCEMCGKGFKQVSALINHRKTHGDEKPFKCDQCFKEFRSKQTLILHMAVHSQNTVETSRVCEICNKTYLTERHLQNHMRKSHKPRELISCDICGKSVPNYAEHIKVHTKPHKCSICDQGFSNLKILKEHSAVHTGERLYECDICKKTFRFSGSLHTHKKTHDLTKRLKCEFCDKQFIYKQQWKGHLEKVHQKYDN